MSMIASSDQRTPSQCPFTPDSLSRWVEGTSLVMIKMSLYRRGISSIIVLNVLNIFVDLNATRSPVTGFLSASLACFTGCDVF